MAGQSLLQGLWQDLSWSWSPDSSVRVTGSGLRWAIRAGGWLRLLHLATQQRRDPSSLCEGFIICRQTLFGMDKILTTDRSESQCAEALMPKPRGLEHLGRSTSCSFAQKLGCDGLNAPGCRQSSENAGVTLLATRKDSPSNDLKRNCSRNLHERHGSCSCLAVLDGTPIAQCFQGSTHGDWGLQLQPTATTAHQERLRC